MTNISSEYFENNSTFNSTADVYVNKDFKLIKDILMITTVVITMVAMGTDISWNQIWEHIRRPFGILIGMFCQFLVMPLAGFAYKNIFRLDSEVATGLLIISCCPGGILSNVFSYYLNGNVSLSVSMTVLSTVLALAMMPLNIWIYTKKTETNKLVLPYRNMALSLIMITSPVLLGMVIKWKLPKTSIYITKWGSGLGFLIFVASFILELTSLKHILYQVSLKLVFTVILMPMTGISIGYFISFLCRMSRSVSTTIAVESGIQNVPVAITIILMSFDIKKQNNLILVPWFYLISQITISCLLCLIHYVIKSVTEKKQSFNTEIKKDIECIGINYI